MANSERRLDFFSSPDLNDVDKHSNPLAKAAAAILNGDLCEAEAIYRRCLENEPHPASAWAGLGATLKKQNKLDQAADAYRAAIHWESKLASSHFRLAEVLLSQARLSESLTACETGIELYNDFGEGLIIRSYIKKHMGLLDEAADDLRLVIERYPDSINTYMILSDIYSLNDKHNLAIDILKKALSIDALNANHHLALATLYRKSGKLREAFDEYIAAAGLDPKSVNAYEGLAWIAAGEYNHTLAASIREFITLLKPDSSIAIYNLGISLNADKKIDAAVDCFKKAIAIDPGFNEALVELSWAQQRVCD